MKLRVWIKIQGINVGVAYDANPTISWDKQVKQAKANARNLWKQGRIDLFCNINNIQTDGEVSIPLTEEERIILKGW